MDDSGREEKPRQPKKPREFRAPLVAGFREVIRCARCGAILSAEVTWDSQCPQCRADLHNCRQCVSFDTAARFECTQPIPERISKKDVRNQCRYFQPRKRVERETSFASSKPQDARKAFDDLFKK